MATTVTNNTKELSQSQQQGVSSSSAMVEDEFIKRNTDCVYFLASPLTCKKGSECEYRHSEYARVNPRDCWYWLNASCLNPKCSFRHPPLDGLVGPQTGNLAGPSTLVPLAPPVPAAPQNPTKEGVPCIFFQKGYCLKGDRCPFMHGSNPASTKVQQPVSVGTATPEAPVIKKTFGSMEKCTQAKGHINVNASKVVEPQVQARVIRKVQSARPTNGKPVGKAYQPPNVGIEEQAPNYNYSTDNGNLKSSTGRAHHGGSYDDLNFQNGRDADDSLRESSPGFDVLVDDKLSEDEFHHNEDQYVSMRGHEGRNMRNYDLVHQEDYNIVPDIEPKLYQNRRGYDSFDRLPEKYAWDHPRASTERSLVEPAQYNRRGSYTKSQSPDYNQNSDLRQRLSSKQGRRVNGLKSVVNPDYDVDAHAEDRGYRSTRRDPHRSPTRGHRLQGRIKLPRRSSPSNGNDVYSERKNERGGDWERSSSTRQQVSVQQGRIQDRLSGRNIEESRVGRRIIAPVMRKDTSSANGLDFAGPKSLSELKSTKQTDSRPSQVKSQQSAAGGKLRDTILASSVGTDGDLSFEGPKPLSEILKRKRTSPTDDAISESNKQENKQHENDVKLASNVLNTVKDTEKQVAMSVEVVNKTVTFEADEEGEILNKKIKLNGEGESYLPDDDDNKNSEVGDVEVIADAKNQEFDEEYDHGDGEYESEQEDGEGYNLNEIETGEHEVDRDEDDEDEFAKMLGVSF